MLIKELSNIVEQQDFINEGLASTINAIRTKAQAAFSALSKFKIKQFASKNKSVIEEITKKLMAQMAKTPKMDSDDFVKFLTKELKANKELAAMPLAESVLEEDFKTVAAKILLDCGTLFMSVMTFMQTQGILKLMDNAPSAMNSVMIKGCTGALIVIVTGALACLVMRVAISIETKK